MFHTRKVESRLTCIGDGLRKNQALLGVGHPRACDPYRKTLTPNPDSVWAWLAHRPFYDHDIVSFVLSTPAHGASIIRNSFSSLIPHCLELEQSPCFDMMNSEANLGHHNSLSWSKELREQTQTFDFSFSSSLEWFQISRCILTPVSFEPSIFSSRAILSRFPFLLAIYTSLLAAFFTLALSIFYWWFF